MKNEIKLNFDENQEFKSLDDYSEVESLHFEEYLYEDGSVEVFRIDNPYNE